MLTTEPFVLPAELLLIPLEHLPNNLRGEIEYNPGDCALVVPDANTPSSIVNADTAELLQQFRVPQAVDDAVSRFCHDQGVDPEAMREEALPLLQELVDAGLLVS